MDRDHLLHAAAARVARRAQREPGALTNKKARMSMVGRSLGELRSAGINFTHVMQYALAKGWIKLLPEPLSGPGVSREPVARIIPGPVTPPAAAR